MNIINKIGTYKLEYIDISNEKYDIANIQCKMKNINRFFKRIIKKHTITQRTNDGNPMLKGSLTFIYENQLVTFGPPMMGLDSEWWTYLDDVIVDIPIIIYK